MASDPTRHGPRYTRGQRRLLTALAGLTVAALAGGAFALTYDVLRDLAVAGRVGARWAPLYPAMADTLTALTILSLVITRNARWWTRLLRWALLLVLVSGGATLSVQHAVWGFGSMPDDAVRAGVAVAPHVMLVIAVWLWLTMFKQIRVARPGPEEEAVPTDRRGHVKVLERAPAADADRAASSPTSPGDREPEREPLIPFPDPPRPVDAPTHEFPARSPETAPEPTEEPAAHEPAAHAQAEPGSAADAPAAPDSAYEVDAGRSLSSEPPPPLDALPEPRPPLDPPPEPSPKAPSEPLSEAPSPPALLPTDVELVRSRKRDGAPEERPLTSTTRPDIVMPGAHGTEPHDADLHHGADLQHGAGFRDDSEEDHDTPSAERAEDPDAGDHPFGEAGDRDAPGAPAGDARRDDAPAGRSNEPGENSPETAADDWNQPPSSSFRSGPTPPVD